MSLIISLLFILNFKNVFSSTSAFNKELYEQVLDSELCQRQLSFLSNNSLGLLFLDASGKVPTNIQSGNLVDLGDYHTCLRIEQLVEDMPLQGKYCFVSLPINTESTKMANTMRMGLMKFSGTGGMNRAAAGALTDSGFSLGVCIPKPCSAIQALQFLSERLPINVTAKEQFCRLPNDKNVAPANYVAAVIFSIILFVTVVSTSYDIYQVFANKNESNKLYSSFSLYTNTRRFLNFPRERRALDCVDGIRSIAMLWVVVGHTFVNSIMDYTSNFLDIYKWVLSYSSLWIVSAPITVDTFFCLSGILCSYTAIGKVTRSYFISHIHLFYLHRLLRMFPLLATVILLQVSWVMHVSDGPNWQPIVTQVESCRRYWWSALLHVQNYVNPEGLCIPQSWYLSVDVQLYVICPVILVFLFDRRYYSWIALSLGILLSLISVAVISFKNNFPGNLINMTSLGDVTHYMKVYYFNTLARASPFFVGLLFGYALLLTKGKRVNIPWYYSAMLWLLSIAMMLFCIVPLHYMSHNGSDDQLLANMFNSFSKAIWASAIGWIVFACAHGYGGPVNWFLSLYMWKLPARLSYAMYLVHYAIMAIANGSRVSLYYFTPWNSVYRFISDLGMTLVASFILCIFIDAPLSTLLNLIFKTKGSKKEKQEITSTSNGEDKNYKKTEN